ncbi:GNAT family N-acetyltransferase [Marivibrio halodurans]|uniref:GNAT family N-acetyltransferase n=1 Tax=Marivibrio halodurans TaxID=2039722 RepID=A0A8J7RZQ6_9PROT|nr:GNAT family N-acetyltransferase [Marivibrio halodurans]MBP5856034.1 GNAT family N-acetyltransferase [Marivibrio halodurans]
MSAIDIRPLDPEHDIDWYYALNEACVPAVNSLPKTRLADLIAESAYARVACIDGDPVGVMIAFGPPADYDSLNFLWFRQNFTDFVYMDRVMVSESARGRGVGALLYGDLFEAMEGRFPFVGCEVNSEPPNPHSMRFHERLGFKPVGEQRTEGGKKAVVLLRRDL